MASLQPPQRLRRPLSLLRIPHHLKQCLGLLEMSAGLRHVPLLVVENAQVEVNKGYIVPVTDAFQDVGIVSARAQIALHFCSRWMTIQRPETFWKLPDCRPAGANCKARFPPR